MRLLALEGDGIGPEIMAATTSVLRVASSVFDTEIDIEHADIGFLSLNDTGTTITREVIKKVSEADGVLLGPVSHYAYPPREEGGLNPSGVLRTEYKLYSNIRPCISMKQFTSVRRPFDIIIVRENTEGFYVDRNMYNGCAEFMSDPDTAFAVRKISGTASRAVAATAFELARSRRRHVTVVHKANVLRMSDAFFLEQVKSVGSDFPDVAIDELLVDSAAAMLIRKPDAYDVLVTTNMYGDILSDEASELAGGLGLAGSINVGADVCIAQAQHGSAPDLAGKHVANPTSLILSAGMLLDWWGQRSEILNYTNIAHAINDAVHSVLASPEHWTADLGGSASTEQFADAICEALRAPKLLMGQYRYEA